MPTNLSLVPPCAKPEPEHPLKPFRRKAMLLVRTLRRACGFKSQLAAAQHFRIGLTSVRCYESGERAPSVEYFLALMKLAQERGVTIAAQPKARAA